MFSRFVLSPILIIKVLINGYVTYIYLFTCVYARAPMPSSFTNNVRYTLSSISRRCGVPAYRQANSMSETVSNGSHRKSGKILMHTMKQGHGVGADLVLGSDAGNLPEVVPRLVMKVTMCGGIYCIRLRAPEGPPNTCVKCYRASSPKGSRWAQLTCVTQPGVTISRTPC